MLGIVFPYCPSLYRFNRMRIMPFYKARDTFRLAKPAVEVRAHCGQCQPRQSVGSKRMLDPFTRFEYKMEECT